MKAQRVLFSILFLSIFGVTVFAETFSVKEATGNGIQKESLETVTQLARSTVIRLKHQITDAKNAKFQLVPRIFRLGESYIVTMEKSSEGKSVYSAELKAKNLDELDVIIKRVTRSAIEEIAVEDDARVGDVAESEINHMDRKKEPAYHWQIGFGPHFLTNLNRGSSNFGFLLGYAWEVRPEFELKIFYHVVTAGAFYGNFGIGLNYFLNEKDIAPIIHGNFGYGVGTTDTNPKEERRNFTVGAGIGFQFFRTSRVKLETLLAASTLLEKNSYGAPGTLGVLVSLYF